MGRRALGIVALVAMAAGCAHKPATNGLPQPWRFEAQTTQGEVRVLPLLAMHPSVPVDRETYVGLPIPQQRERVRAQRAWQVGEMPAVVGERLPGAVNGLLGHSWDGQFRHGGWPMGSQEKLRRVLEENPQSLELDALLGQLARQVGTDATLVTWVRQVEGVPVSKHGFPGAVVDTEVGPVLVNHRDEPFVVNVRVGLALVSGEGEVVIRYEHDYRTLLSSRHDELDAGTELARLVAEDVTKVWATDPELAPAPALLAREGR